MEKNKVVSIKEKQIEAQALKTFETQKSIYVQNPIENKFSTFIKTKKNITIKDLF